VVFGEAFERIVRELLACDCFATDALVGYGDWRGLCAVGTFFESFVGAMMMSVRILSVTRGAKVCGKVCEYLKVK
jgi:hypothetical protein